MLSPETGMGESAVERKDSYATQQTQATMREAMLQTSALGQHNFRAMRFRR
jgi:hypothetical protein